MGKIHFLNVGYGDCSLIEHENIDHKTVIDICNGNFEEIIDDNKSIEEDFSEKPEIKKPKGNFNQKDYPINPINYFKKIGVESIFRFISTHPDMDHLDGIKKLFDDLDVYNFWCIPNNKEFQSDEDGRYKKDDWDFYKNLKSGKESAKTLNIYSGSNGLYYNQEYDNYPNGDCLEIIFPTEDFAREINKSNGNYNNLSYIILYRDNNKKILFTGDSEDEAWNELLKNKKLLDKIRNIDVLIAPHHGRTSGGNDTFLNITKPKLTLFGNAKSDHLNYDDWKNKNLLYITNNQAGSILLEINLDKIDVFCTNEKFRDALISKNIDDIDNIDKRYFSYMYKTIKIYVDKIFEVKKDNDYENFYYLFSIK